MKYAGSKESIADEILPIINGYIIINNIDTYIEPFVGGCNIIDKVQCKNRFGYDKNKYLIELLKHIQKSDELPETISREQYMDFRSHYNADDKAYPDWLLAAVGLLTTGNGEMFNNGKVIKHFNDKTYTKGRESILKQAKMLHDVEFNESDYMELSPKNSLIYCDAPYSGNKELDSVTKQFNYREFWNTMREWSKSNIVLISENKAPDDFDMIWEQTDDGIDSSKLERLFIHKCNNKENVEYSF